jgi:hypothetical protein
MNAGIEQRARELLAVELSSDADLARMVKTGSYAGLVYATEALRAIVAALQTQQPGAQAVAWRYQFFGEKGWSWALVPKVPDFIKGRAIIEPLYTHPQPPSIPEPSEADVEASCIAYDAELGINTSPEWLSEIDDKTPIRAALTTYTARLRERIGGGYAT